MSRTYEYDLTTGEWMPIFTIGYLRQPETGWDIAKFPDLDDGFARAVESTMDDLITVFEPVRAMFEDLATWTELELMRTLDLFIPHLQTFAAAALAATATTDADPETAWDLPAAIAPAPSTPPQTRALLVDASAPTTAAPDDSAVVAPSAANTLRRSYFGWLRHEHWNGINGVIALLALLVAVLAYLQSLSP
jgi:hypothetical protein